MDIQEKMELNKRIRKYEGTNGFIISLQKTLKTGKFVERVEYDGKTVKLLTEKQYEAVKGSLD
jgi:hypothetical protein